MGRRASSSFRRGGGWGVDDSRVGWPENAIHGTKNITSGLNDREKARCMLCNAAQRGETREIAEKGFFIVTTRKISWKYFSCLFASPLFGKQFF